MPSSAPREVRALLAGSDGLWVGTTAGLYRDTGDGVVDVPGLPDELRNADVDDLIRDGQGRIMAATSQGVGRQINGGDFELLSVDHGLATEITHQLIVDREGVIWMAQDNGLSKLVPGPFMAYTVSSGLLSDFVRTINEDPSGRLWLGTRVGIQVVPNVDGEWRMDRADIISEAEGLPDERIYSIHFPGPGEAKIATYNGVVHWREGEGVIEVYTTEDGLPTNRTQALHEDRRGRLWISTNLGTVFRENGAIHRAPGSALPDAYAFRIREDHEGRLWFATLQHGLILLEPDGEYRQLMSANGLTNETLWDIAPSADGSMWVGSNGEGLFRVTADGDVRQYTEDDGLVDDFVWQVLEDDAGQVWAYTNRGLSRFDGERFHNYKERDGLLHLEGGATGAWQSRDGQLWFASAAGLMRYDADQEYHNDVPPPATIESVTLGGERLTSGARLPYRPGSLEFSYAGLSFHDEDAVVYRYRLLGADESWSDPVSRQIITFANLGGGEYRFEVKARNPHGVWSTRPAQFDFEVQSPYWASLWFWALVLPVGSGLLFGAVRLRIRQSEVRRRELEVIVGERTAELEEANRKLLEVSVTDPLTGLPNRRFLMARIEDDVALVRRAYVRESEHANRDLIFMMVDIDHFKQINDNYGHDVGDSILRDYGRIIDSQLRDSDYVVRWGGEEFLIVARQAEGALSRVIVERIIDRVRKFRFKVDEEGTEIACTCSIGVAYLPFLRTAPDALTWEQIVQVSDVAVYRAKAMGRDGWVCIEAKDGLEFDDGQALVQQMKVDLDAMIDRGEVCIDSSFDGGGSA